MPLAFRSVSHGTVAFGFFNIDSDMLLLERLFFFADRFCAAVVELARAGVAGPSDPAQVSLEGWRIDRPERIGNLHGAIAGVDHSGFIGATYRRYPFPARQEDFKQSPLGARTQGEFAELIGPFADPATVELRREPEPAALVHVGSYSFAERDFARLCGYVAEGGYPRYRDEEQPGYVREMMAALAELGSPWCE